MIFIDDTKRNIIKAKKEHYEIVSKYFKRKKKKTTPLEDEIKFFVLKYLNLLLKGKPNYISKLNLKFYDSLNGYDSNSYLNYLDTVKIHHTKRTPNQKILCKKYKNLSEIILKIVNYDNWFITSPKQYDYKLAQNLGINTCTYCNRIYTNTMKTTKEKKLMRPQFDHWYPKSKFPLLALSFYNLIPSCSVCNSSAKSDAIFNLNDHLHPYVDKNITQQLKFSYDYFKSLNQCSIKINHNFGNKKAFNTFSDMNLKTMYNAHIDELKDLILTKKAYSKSYLQNMMKAYPKAGLSNEEIYRLAFGTELNEFNFSKRPFSKFKKDILTELKIIE